MEERQLAVVSYLGPAPAGDRMTAQHALSALSALGQSTRLGIFRLLIGAGPDGLLAGALAEAVGCPHNTLSSHLSILARAGLIRGTRDGRTILYRADVEAMRSLLVFLVTDCCDGHPELCNFLDEADDATCNCPPRQTRSSRRRP